MPNKWTEFVKDWALKNNFSYGCAMTKQEVKDAYRAANPKVSKSTKRRNKLKEVPFEKLEEAFPSTEPKQKNIIIKKKEPVFKVREEVDKIEKKLEKKKEPKTTIDGKKYYLQIAKLGEKEYFITKEKDPYGNKLMIKKDGMQFGVYDTTDDEFFTTTELDMEEAIEQFGKEATKWYIQFGFLDLEDIKGGKAGTSFNEKMTQVNNRMNTLMAGPDVAWQGEFQTLTEHLANMEDALNEIQNADDADEERYYKQIFLQHYNESMDIFDKLNPIEGGMLPYPRDLYAENYRIDDLKGMIKDRKQQLDRLKYKEFQKNREIESVLKGDYKDHYLADEMLNTLVSEQDTNMNRSNRKIKEIENMERRSDKAKKMVMDLDKSKGLKGFTDSKGNTIYGESVGNWVSSVVMGRQDYPPKMREVIKKYGDKTILRMFACRTPIGPLLTSALNAVSLGEFYKRWDNQPYDKLFHLDLRVDVIEDPKSRKITTVLLEKTEVLKATVNPKKQKDTECILINVFPRPMTINKMLAAAQQIQGDKFFKYSAYNNNCQDFIMALLKGVGAGTQENYDFIKQDTKELFKGLPGTRKLANTVTDLGATFNTLIEGAGAGPSVLEPRVITLEDYEDYEPYQRQQELETLGEPLRREIRELEGHANMLRDIMISQAQQHGTVLTKTMEEYDQTMFIIDLAKQDLAAIMTTEPVAADIMIQGDIPTVYPAQQTQQAEPTGRGFRKLK